MRLLLTTVPISLFLGNCIFVDYRGLNDRITSTNQTGRWANFRQDVLERDGLFCVITQESAEHCGAAHPIPWSKRDEVMFVIIRCGSSMMVCSNTLGRLSKIVLPFMAAQHLQFLGLMLLRFNKTPFST